MKWVTQDDLRGVQFIQLPRFTRMGLCKLPCAVLLALPDGSADQPCQQFWYDLLRNQEIPGENQITQTTATFSESHQKSRPGHGELRVTVNFCSQPKSSDPSRQQRKSWAGTGRSAWRGELPGWAAPGEHRVAGSAVGHSRVAGPIPVQRSGLTEQVISEESRPAPRLRPPRRSPGFPAPGRSLSGGGARGKRNSAGRSAPPRAGSGHGCRCGPGAAPGSRGPELRLLPAVLHGARAAHGLQPQLLPALHRRVLQGEAARRLPALPGRLRAEGPAAQPGTGRFGELNPAGGEGRRAGNTGWTETLRSCCLQRPELGGATWEAGTAGGSAGLPPAPRHPTSPGTARGSPPRHPSPGTALATVLNTSAGSRTNVGTWLGLSELYLSFRFHPLPPRILCISHANVSVVVTISCTLSR